MTELFFIAGYFVLIGIITYWQMKSNARWKKYLENIALATDDDV